MNIYYSSELARMIIEKDIICVFLTRMKVKILLNRQVIA